MNTDNMPLKFTKNQALILEIFFYNTEKSYFFRQLSRILKKAPGNFQRDINTLVKEGILKSYYQANSRFFELNKEYLLYNELKSIFYKTSGIQGVLKKMLKKIEGIEEAFIYGSFAQGKEKITSDIDIFIIGTINEDEFIDAIGRLEKKIGREINYTLMPEKEFQKKIKAKDSFLANIFHTKRIKLI